MAISVECGKCGRVYKVRDEMAGNRIRCKDCSAPIQIPAAEDEFDEPQDEDDFLPPVRKKKSKKSRKSSWNGPPITIIVSLICLVAMLLVTFYEVYKLIEVLSMMGPGMQLKPRGVGMIAGVILRLGLQLAVLFAVFTRKGGIRIPAAILAFVFAAFQGLVAMSPLMNAEQLNLVLMSIAVRITFGICMLLPPSQEYLDQ